MFEGERRPVDEVDNATRMAEQLKQQERELHGSPPLEVAAAANKESERCEQELVMELRNNRLEVQRRTLLGRNSTSRCPPPVGK